MQDLCNQVYSRLSRQPFLLNFSKKQFYNKLKT
jgi:hypothetical protein